MAINKEQMAALNEAKNVDEYLLEVFAELGKLGKEDTDDIIGRIIDAFWRAMMKVYSDSMAYMKKFYDVDIPELGIEVERLMYDEKDESRISNYIMHQLAGESNKMVTLANIAGIFNFEARHLSEHLCWYKMQEFCDEMEIVRNSVEVSGGCEKCPSGVVSIRTTPPPYHYNCDCMVHYLIRDNSGKENEIWEDEGNLLEEL